MIKEQRPVVPRGPHRGDVQVDANGSRWIVTNVVTANGKADTSRIRVGSLAHEVIFGRRS